MGDIAWVSQVKCCSYRVKESDSLICAGTNDKLSFLQIAYVYDRGIVSLEFSEYRDIPRRVGLEKVNHIFL